MGEVDTNMTDWPDSYKELRNVNVGSRPITCIRKFSDQNDNIFSQYEYYQDLDDLLRCPICYEYIDTAMLVPKCSHNYCSLCIRKYICYKTQCPTCTAAVAEPDLINNRVLDDFIQKFNVARPKLLGVLKKSIEQCLQAPGSVVVDSSKDSRKETAAQITESFREHKSPVTQLVRNTTPAVKKSRTGKVKLSHKDQDDDWLVKCDEIIKDRQASHPKRQVRQASKAAKKTFKSLCDENSDESGSDFDDGSARKRKQKTRHSAEDEDYQLVSDALAYSSDDDFSLLSPSGRHPSKNRNRTVSHKSDLAHSSICDEKHKSTKPIKKNSADLSTSSENDDVVCLSYIGSPRTPQVNSKSQNRPDIVSPTFGGRQLAASEEWKKVLQPPVSKILTSPIPGGTSSGSASPKVVSHSSSFTVPSPGPSSQTSQGGNVPKVPCPVCGVEVPERNINLHLDRCLSGGPAIQSTRSHTKRKRMAKVVYNLLKDKDLKKKCSVLGLSTQGDRHALIARHKEFCLRYNAQCDSLNPKSEQEILRDMQRDEKAKATVSIAAPSSGLPKLAVIKGASADDVDKAQKDYVKAHKSQFAQLIADAKKRQQKLKVEPPDEQILSHIHPENPSAVVDLNSVTKGHDPGLVHQHDNVTSPESKFSSLQNPHLPSLPKSIINGIASDITETVNVNIISSDSDCYELIGTKSVAEDLVDKTNEAGSSGLVGEQCETKTLESFPNTNISHKSPTRAASIDSVNEVDNALPESTASGCKVEPPSGQNVNLSDNQDGDKQPEACEINIQSDIDKDFPSEVSDIKQTVPLEPHPSTKSDKPKHGNHGHLGENCESFKSSIDHTMSPDKSSVPVGDGDTLSNIWPDCTEQEEVESAKKTCSVDNKFHDRNKNEMKTPVAVTNSCDHLLTDVQPDDPDVEKNPGDEELLNTSALVPSTPEQSTVLAQMDRCSSASDVQGNIVGDLCPDSSPSHVSESLPGSLGSSNLDNVDDGEIIPQSPEEVQSSKAWRIRGKRKRSEDIRQTETDLKRTRVLDAENHVVDPVLQASPPRRRSLRPRKKAL